MPSFPSGQLSAAPFVSQNLKVLEQVKSSVEIAPEIAPFEYNFSAGIRECF